MFSCTPTCGLTGGPGWTCGCRFPQADGGTSRISGWLLRPARAHPCLERRDHRCPSQATVAALLPLLWGGSGGAHVCNRLGSDQTPHTQGCESRHALGEGCWEQATPSAISVIPGLLVPACLPTSPDVTALISLDFPVFSLLRTTHPHGTKSPPSAGSLSRSPWGPDVAPLMVCEPGEGADTACL